MGTQVESRERTGHGYVPTGDLPPPEMVKVLMSEAYEHFRSNAEGRNSDICPALVRVPPATCSARAWLAHNGNLYAVGDANHAFSIMSVSKPFVSVSRSAPSRPARGSVQQHRAAVQLAIGNRTKRGWTNQPDGECRGHSNNQPRACHDHRSQVEIQSRGFIPLCRTRADIERGGLCLRLADQLSQPEHRAAAARALAGSISIRNRQLTSTPGNALSM